MKNLVLGRHHKNPWGTRLKPSYSIIHLPDDELVLGYTIFDAETLANLYMVLTDDWAYPPTGALAQMRLLFPYSLDLIDALEDELVVKALEALL